MASAGLALPRFETVLFAGGGNRCFWQAGFWTVAMRRGLPPPAEILAVSGGAFVACGLYAQVMERLLESTANLFAANKKNFYLSRALLGRNPFPHARIYRTALDENFSADEFVRLQQAPPVYMLAAASRRSMPLGLNLLFSSMAQITAMLVLRRQNMAAGRRGYLPVWLSSQQLAAADELVDAICMSSSVPPIFPVLKRDGRRAIDGGFYDTRPLSRQLRPSRTGRVLALLTRPLAECPPLAQERVVYAAPSQPVPVGGFDTTAADGIRAAFQLGLRDGERFMARILRSTAAEPPPLPSGQPGYRIAQA